MSYKFSSQEIENLKDLYNLALEEKNEDIINDCNSKLDQLLVSIKKNEINCFIRRKR